MAKAKKSKKPNRKPIVTATGKLAALARKAQDAPASGGMWRAEVEGDTIVGEILSIREEQGRFGPQTVMILDAANGPTTVFCNASLDRGLKDAGAKKGSTVAVSFKGKISTGKGRPFKLFSVVKK